MLLHCAKPGLAFTAAAHSPSARRSFPKKQEHPSTFEKAFRRYLSSSLTGAGIAAALLLTYPSCGEASQLFEKNCAGCHAGGGNIVQRNASLKTEDMQRNSAASPEQIYDLIYSGKGKMPGYGTNCAPKGKCTFAARLSDSDIRDLSQYVLDQAANGWK